VSKERTDDFDLREAERRIANLVLLGTIEQVVIDGPAEARATVRSGELLTAPLRWMCGRMGNRRDWNPPKYGEQVLLICPDGDPAQGVIAGSLGSNANPDPSGNPRLFKTAFADGSYWQIDLDTHEMSVGCAGKISVAADGDIQAVTAGRAKVAAVGNIEADTQAALKASAAESAEVTAPEIRLIGNVTVVGNLTMSGTGSSVQMEGDVTLLGRLAVAGETALQAATVMGTALAPGNDDF